MKNQSNVALKYLTGGSCFCFALLAARLIYIQGFQPESPRYTLGSAPPQISYTPALRGEILDSRGQRLVHSQFLFNLRANPALIGEQGPALAAHLAPSLGVPVAHLTAKFRSQPEWRWKQSSQTNATGLLLTNWSRTLYTNQSVLIATNLTLDDWTLVHSNLLTYVPARERELKQAWAALELRRIHSPKFKLWELPARYAFQRALAKDRRQIAGPLKVERLTNNIVRNTAITREIVERRIYTHDSLALPILGSTTNGAIPLVEYRTSLSTLQLPAKELPPALKGASGIERQFDTELPGVPGKAIMRVRGSREFANTQELEIKSKQGTAVRLTLDANLQSVAEDALRTGMERLKPNWMSAIVVEVASGEILALANATDPNYLPLGVTNKALLRQQPPRNHAVSDLIEPGSTFKLVTYAAALDLGRITPDSLIDCEGGSWRPPAGRRKPVVDSRGHHLKTVSVEEAFATSSNVGAAKIAYYELWDPKAPSFQSPLCFYANAFGFNRRTGILCGGEPITRIPAWDGIGTQIILSYGYGIYVTPLQVCMAYAAIANDGFLMEPMLVKSIEHATGSIIRTFPPKQVGQVVRPETARQLLRLLTAVVSPKGTGKDAILEGYTVAGKTGTANKMTKEHLASGANAHFSTFVGFLPAERPKFCLLVCADEPTNMDGRAAYGAACIPTFKQIAISTASYLTIPFSSPVVATHIGQPSITPP